MNTTSEAGLFGSAGQANYAAAKGAIATLTITLAREYERFGVTVNAIAPRARTRMTTSALGSLEPEPGAFDSWAPENVAPVVVWLASDATSGISGQFFVVWGGAVHLVAPYSPVASLRREGAWSVERADRPPGGALRRSFERGPRLSVRRLNASGRTHGPQIPPHHSDGCDGGRFQWILSRRFGDT